MIWNVAPHSPTKSEASSPYSIARAAAAPAPLLVCWGRAHESAAVFELVWIGEWGWRYFIRQKLVHLPLQPINMWTETIASLYTGQHTYRQTTNRACNGAEDAPGGGVPRLSDEEQQAECQQDEQRYNDRSQLQPGIDGVLRTFSADSRWAHCVVSRATAPHSATHLYKWIQ